MMHLYCGFRVSLFYECVNVHATVIKQQFGVCWKFKFKYAFTRLLVTFFFRFFVLFAAVYYTEMKSEKLPLKSIPSALNHLIIKFSAWIFFFRAPLLRSKQSVNCKIKTLHLKLITFCMFQSTHKSYTFIFLKQCIL